MSGRGIFLDLANPHIFDDSSLTILHLKIESMCAGNFFTNEISLQCLGCFTVMIFD